LCDLLIYLTWFISRGWVFNRFCTGSWIFRESGG